MLNVISFDIDYRTNTIFDGLAMSDSIEALGKDFALQVFVLGKPCANSTQCTSEYQCCLS
jgi:hypothetical protein